MRSSKLEWRSLNSPSKNINTISSRLSMTKLIKRNNSNSIKSKTRPPAKTKMSLGEWKIISKLRKRSSKAEN